MPRYVKSQLVPGSKLFFVGEAPGRQEDRYGVPFYPGAPGGKRLTRLLSEAGLSRGEISLGNVAKERPPGNKVDFFFEDKKMTTPKPILSSWIEELKREIEMIKPNIVVALGATAMWALTGQKGIKDERGYLTQSTLVPGQKMITTWHPQKVNYEPTLMFDSVMDMRKAKSNSLSPDMPMEERRLNFQPSFLEMREYMEFLIHDHKDPVALDIESINNEVTIIGLADNPLHSLSFSLLDPDKKSRLTLESEIRFWNLFADVVRLRPTIMHNGLYDMAMLWYKHHVLCNKYELDTMIAGHVLWPEAPRSLGYLSSICLNVPKWKHTSSENPTLYNAEDAANTYGIWAVMEPEMERMGVRHTFDFEMQQVWPATKMQLQGIPVDQAARHAMIRANKVAIHTMEEKLEAELGYLPNINSPKQMIELLYFKLNLPKMYMRRKSRLDPRKLTANKEALGKLQRKVNSPVLEYILQIRKLKKLMTFLDVPVSPNNTVHTSYNITGATMTRAKKGWALDDEERYKSFGRWSSSSSIILPYGSGNLQNNPKEARKIYRAPSGSVYVQADYIQAEAVVVAYLINDVSTKEMFAKSFGCSPEERKKKGYDIHRNTAARMLGIKPVDVTKAERSVGKTLRHATNYSAGPGVVATWLGITVTQAKELFQKFHEATPQLQIWHESIKQELKDNHRTLTNLLGRQHKFMGRWDDNLFRSAYSFKPQSTVGDLMNLALCRMYQNHGDELDIRLQLHDAVYVICEDKDSVIADTMEMMRDCMIIPLETPEGEKFAIDVDFSMGPSWGEMEEV
jgi:DNA polymerase-1